MTNARILIVEDEAIIGMELQENIERLGYTVTSVVSSGEKALEKTESEQPDLVLMDIRIKGDMDGIDAAEIIRNRFGVPVVFSTAYLDEERIERAKIAMPFGYVLKPIQERDLKVTLEMALYVAEVDAARRDAEDEIKKNEIRLSALLELYQLKEATEREIFDFALEKCLLITESAISFLGLISPDESAMDLHAWSESAMKDCAVIDKPIHFRIDEAGIWAEAVRSRKPLIVQNYSADHPSKMGLPDGHVLLSNMLVVPIFEKETIAYIIAVANKEKPYSETDITQLQLLLEGVTQIIARRAIELELKIEQEKYERAFRISPDAVNINRLDGLYIDINEGFTRLTGFTREDVIGKLSSEINIWAIPEDREKLIAGLQNKGHVDNLESTFRCKDGSHKIALMSAAIIEINNEPHILSITRDISDRKRMQKRLQESELIFTQQFYQSATSMCLYNPEGTIEKANPEFCRMFGVDEKEIVASKYNMFQDQAIIDGGVIPHLETVFYQKEKANWNIVFDLDLASNSTGTKTVKSGKLELDVVAYPILDQKGEILYVVLQHNDISDKKRCIDAESL